MGNQLQTIEDIEHLKECKSIRDLDVSCNKLDDFGILDVYAAMPALIAVKNNGNPVVSTTRHYRKNALVKLPNLKYLDRPIEDFERVGAKAWKEGGREAEIAVRDANNRDEKRERKQSMATYHRWCKEMREKKDAEIAAIKEKDPTANPSRWHAHGQNISYSTRTDAEEEEERERMRQDAENAEALDKESWNMMYYGSSRKGNNLVVEEVDEGDMPPELGEDGETQQAAAPPLVPVLPEWNEPLDEMLSALVRPCLFDFEKVASQLQEQMEGQGLCYTKEGRSVLCTADSCRKRFAALKKQEKLAAEVAKGGGKSQKLVWTATLDSKLPKMVRTHAFDFAKAAEALAKELGGKVEVSADDVRTRFAELKKKQQKKVPVGWNNTVDQQLRKLCRSSGFDFDKASTQLEAECGFKATPDMCRMRFAELRKEDKQKKEQETAKAKQDMQSSQKKAETPPATEQPEVPWTEALDKRLQDCVKKFSFDFEKAAAAVGIDAQRCRQRFAVLRKSGKKEKKKAEPTKAPRAKAAEVKWTPELDATLTSSVRKHMFNFPTVAKDMAAAIGCVHSAELETASKARFMALRRKDNGKQSKELLTTRATGLTAEAQAAVASYPLENDGALPPAKHMSWDELTARACAASMDNCRYAPKKLPSFEDPLGSDDDDQQNEDEENIVAENTNVAPSKSASASVKPLSRTDILKEIAMGKLGNLDAMD